MLQGQILDNTDGTANHMAADEIQYISRPLDSCAECGSPHVLEIRFNDGKGWKPLLCSNCHTKHNSIKNKQTFFQVVDYVQRSDNPYVSYNFEIFEDALDCLKDRQIAHYGKINEEFSTDVIQKGQYETWDNINIMMYINGTIPYSITIKQNGTGIY